MLLSFSRFPFHALENLLELGAHAVLEWEEKYMNIGLILIALVGGLSGGLATLYLTFSFPAVIVWKLYRKFAKKIPLTK